MFADRSHFLMKLEVVIIVYASARMFQESGMDLSGWSWHLRPHHVSLDFADLLGKVNFAFERLAASHYCWLFRKVRAVIVVGKWCVQTRICNARGCNPVFVKEIKEGYFQGCTERPRPGNHYCQAHCLSRAASSPSHVIVDHRKVNWFCFVALAISFLLLLLQLGV
jgi:hypothetical protein